MPRVGERDVLLGREARDQKGIDCTSAERERRNSRSGRESKIDQRTRKKEKVLSKKLGLALLLAVAMSLSLVSVAFASGGDDRDDHNKHGKHYKAHLNPLNRSGAEGHAILEKEGKKKVETEIHTKGLASKLPHAQHIHGFKKALSECPTLAASGRDNLITTAEGLPSYGPIQASLTTKGDTSPKSALAVDRFPVANAKGTVQYERTFSVSANVAKNLGKKVIVQHGVDLNHNGKYDFKAAGKSELDPSLPQEATIPATCGVINPK
jgi:hypothetical protein